MGKIETTENVIPTNDAEVQFSVLVVDDSAMQRKLVSVHLKKWGFKLFEADSGQSALEICKAEKIDLILSDWMMPGMTGPEFCQKFRKLDRDRYGYFILLTSKSEKDEIAMGLDMGADDFLSKPVNKAELRARIRAGERVLEMETKLQKENEKTNRALEEIRLINAEINKDLAQAEKLQKSLIPEPHIITENYVISNLFQSSGHVGGDLVGKFQLTKERIAIYSLDVSGHGVSSALLTVQLAGLLSPYQKENNLAFKTLDRGEFGIRSPSEIAATFNAVMLDQMATELYFTLAYADINLETGHVEMVQAGHPFPILFDRQKKVTRLGAGGPPIGLIPGIEFEGFSFTLNPMDKLLLHSDGLTECQNSHGDLLDDEGLEAILLNHSQNDGPELLSDIYWELTQFADGEDFGDDVSAILFEYTP